MKKTIPILLLCLGMASLTAAQTAKKNTPTLGGPMPAGSIHWPGKTAVPAAENPFQLPEPNFNPKTTLLRPSLASGAVRIERDGNGQAIVYIGQTTMPDGSRPGTALDYLAALHPEGITDPRSEFEIAESHTDEQGNTHVRLQQMFEGVPVFGAEVIAHTHAGNFDMLNGRSLATPLGLNTTPGIDAANAIDRVKTAIGREKVKEEWSEFELKLVGGQPFRSQLVIFTPEKIPAHARLAWHVRARPNLLQRLEYFVDAQNGAILHFFDNTCQIDGGRHKEASHLHTQSDMSNHTPGCSDMPPPNGAITASGLDLLNVNRSFGAWQDGSTVYMEDASKSMFNPTTSQMPNDPVGVIITYDGLNTSPENSNFNYNTVTSNSSTFNNKKAVSAHWNSNKSFDYYKTTFNRNSIDGNGGNIIGFINIAESDGSSMENAFWNGDAMWYGNGGIFFKELARGLDVGGHEMTHGVVEKTANLLYQNESGALNESFADVFAAMIDRDDWKIGEDVMQAGVSPNNCLRDLSNPHNGDSQGGQWWQPQHMNEKYTGTQDNGGVHINSGIPNRAFYLFANNANVGKEKAEQVYYKALRDYLVKSSQFTDLRIAVLQAANDLYGATVASAAATAFDQVGIGGSSPGGNYLGQLAVNPGTDYVLCVTNDQSTLELATGAGNILGSMYNQGVASKPSVTDNGAQIVFVDEAGNVIGLDVSYGNPISFQTSVLSDFPEWRNAAISKDGRFVAALSETQENTIYVFDFFTGLSEVFTLYNPTYSQGQVTGDVQFADVLEFDYSGKYVMYDAFNELSNSLGQDISYWDIGFIEFWKNGSFTDGNNPFISKLFSGLPENTSIADPAFSKNSPFIITFDFIDNNNGTYSIFGANVETGDNNVIVSDVGSLGWPGYNKLDNSVIFESPGFFGLNIYKIGVNSSKIQSQGNITQFIPDHNWGVWYANGTRSLTVNTGMLEIDDLKISASPNPTKGELQLSVEAINPSAANIYLIDMLGRTLLTRQLEMQTGINMLDIDLSSLPTGQYLVRLDTANGIATTMVVKQ